MDQKNDQKSDHFLDPKNGNLNRTKAPIGENPSLMMVVFDPPDGVQKWSFLVILVIFDFLCVKNLAISLSSLSTLSKIDLTF